MADAKRCSVGVAREDVLAQSLQDEGFTRLVVSAQPVDSARQLLAGKVELVPLLDREVLMLCMQARGNCATMESIADSRRR